MSHQTTHGVSYGENMLKSQNIFRWQLEPHRDAQTLSTHALTRFHIPLLRKHVVSRLKVSINNNALQFEAVSRVRERRHLPGAQEAVWLMLCSTVFSPVKQGAFIGPLWPQQAEDWVPLMLWNSYYAAQNEWGDNPRHLFSHLSTHIHITKRACVRGVFICIVWSSLYATGGERETKGINICSGASFSISRFFSDFQSLWNLSSRRSER